MNRIEEFNLKLKEYFSEDRFDPPEQHRKADILMIEELTALGYDCRAFVEAIRFYE